MWQFNRRNQVATNTIKKEDFKVAFAETTDDIEVTTMEGAEHGLDAASLQSLTALCISERNRFEVEKILRDTFKGNYLEAVVALNQADDRKVSVRTLQAWLMEPGKASSRTCPTWAVNQLKHYQIHSGYVVADAQKRFLGVQEEPGRYEAAYNGGASRAIENERASDARYKEKIASYSLGELPSKLADEFLALKKENKELSSYLMAVIRSIDSAESFDELKTKLDSTMKDLGKTHRLVTSMKDAVETSTEEFAQADGTLPKETGLGDCLFPGD